MLTKTHFWSQVLVETEDFETDLIAIVHPSEYARAWFWVHQEAAGERLTVTSSHWVEKGQVYVIGDPRTRTALQPSRQPGGVALATVEAGWRSRLRRYIRGFGR